METVKSIAISIAIILDIIIFLYFLYKNKNEIIDEYGRKDAIINFLSCSVVISALIDGLIFVLYNYVFSLFVPF